jgi:hypothetical protein
MATIALMNGISADSLQWVNGGLCPGSPQTTQSCT